MQPTDRAGPGIDRPQRARLRLVSDDYGRSLYVGPVRVVVAPAESQPFAVDVVAVEEDTHLLLSAASEVREPTETIDTMLRDVFDARPISPGSIRVRRTNPVQMLAVVHDIDREPMWREEWIVRALRRLLHAVDRRRLASLRLPLLGTRHGSIDPRRVAFLTGQALDRMPGGSLRRVWLDVPAQHVERVSAVLRTRLRA